MFTAGPDSQAFDLNSLPIFTGLPKFGFVWQRKLLAVSSWLLAREAEWSLIWMNADRR